MKTYIHSSALISPQPLFNADSLPAAWENYPAALRLRCIDPPYREYLDPMASRRMSRIVRMSVCGALLSLRKAGVEVPDAIIAGTGLGCLEDTGKFLGSIYANGEKLLNPTPFIQSTHNTVAGAIALALKCHGYNATYSQRGFSFDSAMADAHGRIEENRNSRMLVCSFDELTDDSYSITRRLGQWRIQPVDSLNLLESKGTGSLPGEGAAFFVVSGVQVPGSVCLHSMQTLFRPSYAEVELMIHSVLDEIRAEAGMPDIVLLGVNGDSDGVYGPLAAGILSEMPVGGFKHLCGEYDTAVSFALGLAVEMIRSERVPDGILLKGSFSGKPRSILIYNHRHGIYHSLYHIWAC
jgi:hypothetical protein